MKKYIAAFLLIGSLGSALAYEQEFLDAHKRMYTNEMTRYAQVADYQPEALVTREQAAKFFVAFDRVVMGRDAETLMYCVYSDEAIFDTTLAGAIQSACNRNLMRGSNGVFGSKEYLTKAQAITILIRSLQGTKEEKVTPRWKNYFVAAQETKLTKEADVYALDRPLTRYELGLLLWRVQNPLTETANTNEQDLADVYGLLQELGLQQD